MAKKSLLRGIVTTNLIPWTPVLAGLTQYDPENEELALIIRTVKRECSYSPRSNAGDIFCALAAEFIFLTTGEEVDVKKLKRQAKAPTTKALRKGYPGDCFHPNEWHSFPFAKGVRL
jgi:hypothetical protein